MNVLSINDRATPLRIAIRDLAFFLRSRNGRYGDHHSQYEAQFSRSDICFSRVEIQTVEVAARVTQTKPPRTLLKI